MAIIIKIVRLAVLLAACGASTAQATINPEAIRGVSSEGVIIDVVASRFEQLDKTTHVYLAARVVEVVWSETALMAGALILIAYHQDHEQLKKDQAQMKKQHKKGWAGPQVMSYPPALKAGTRYMAYLKRLEDKQSTGTVYMPDAHQYSFERETLEQRMERMKK